MHHCSEGSRNCQGGTNLQAMTDPPGNHVSSGRWGPQRGKHSCQSFLLACGAALQACPNKALVILMYPIDLLTGNMSLTGLLMATPQLNISSRNPIPSPSHPRRLTTTTHPTGNKWQHLPRCEEELDCSGDGEPASHHGELPQQRQRGEDPLAEHLRGTHWEAFYKDLDLVRHIWQTYF